MKIGDMYTNGQYLKHNPTWGADDAAWKTELIYAMIQKHGLKPAPDMRNPGVDRGRSCGIFSRRWRKSAHLPGMTYPHRQLTLPAGIPTRNLPFGWQYF